MYLFLFQNITMRGSLLLIRASTKFPKGILYDYLSLSTKDALIERIANTAVFTLEVSSIRSAIILVADISSQLHLEMINKNQ